MSSSNNKNTCGPTPPVAQPLSTTTTDRVITSPPPSEFDYFPNYNPMATAIKSSQKNNKTTTSTFHDNLHHQNQRQHFQNMLKSTSPTPLLHKRTTSASDPPPSQSTRQLLPVLVCLLTFATVLSVLIIYMDTTEIRHQQFRLNMTRDYDLVGVTQDDPLLIAYVREVYLRRYSNAPVRLLTSPEQHQQLWDYRGRSELTPRMAQYVVDELLNSQRHGVFVQSMTGGNDRYMTAQWLSSGGASAWEGVVVEPELRKYFGYRKEMGGVRGVEVMHACVSPHEYPKEVDWRREGVSEKSDSEKNEVKIDSLLGEVDEDEEGDEDDGDSEAGRVKCFPLYTILLATNRTTVDLLSLGCPAGQHLQILQTLPFDRVEVQVISLHFGKGEDLTQVVGNVSRFLYGKGFELVKRMEHSYFYQVIAGDGEVEREHEEKVEGGGN